jgi:FAD/FMN-containing dehydrogenase
VKSVAGYDLHKLFLGARHTLGVITQITFRTYSASYFERLKFDWTRGEASGPDEDLWIQRTRRTEFGAAVSAVGGNLALADHGSRTLWCYLKNGPPQRFPGDWVLRPHAPAPPLIENADAKAVMAKIKALFDPANNLNPGGFDLS